MIYLRLALYEKLLRRTDGTGHGYLLYYSIHFCACLQFSIVIHFKSLFSVKAESSPATQFESINSSVLSLLYGPTLTPIRYYRKNHSFEYMVCRQSDVPTFQYAVYVCHSFPRSKHFLISWLQSPSAVIFEPKETKPVTASTIRHRHSKIFKAKQKLTLNWLSLVINSIPISTASEQQL